MAEKTKVFLDSSILLAGLHSDKGGSVEVLGKENLYNTCKNRLLDTTTNLAIAKSLQKVCETVHDDSLKRARDYAKNLTWENSAKETLTVFKNL